MSVWPGTKARRVLRALSAIGWQESTVAGKRGSHIQLRNRDYPYEYTWAFHDGEEIGPVMLSKIAKKTGLKPSDL